MIKYQSVHTTSGLDQLEASTQLYTCQSLTHGQREETLREATQRIKPSVLFTHTRLIL